jgi:AraC family transcriptional regulator
MRRSRIAPLDPIDPAAGTPAAKGGIAPRMLQRVLGYIQDNLDRPIRLKALAAIVGLSEHRFAHNFKQATGLAPYRYVTAQRVEQAKRMLRDTDMTITEVALTAGFPNASRFSGTFGRLTGSTPSEFRSRSK